MIYQEITESKFIDVMVGEGNYFSRSGAKALYEYLEDNIGNIEFDPIGLRCQFTEYDNIEEFCNDNQLNIDDYQSIDDIENGCSCVIMIDEESFIISE